MYPCSEYIIQGAKVDKFIFKSLTPASIKIEGINKY